MSRVNIQKTLPDAYNALFGLEAYLANATLAAPLQELVRLRASQINGCNFCIDMHTKAAMKQGVATDQLAALEHWQDSGLFDKKEQAVLSVTEAVTLIAEQGLPDSCYQAISQFLNGEEIAQLIMLIATINIWNRIGIATAR